MGRVWNWFGSSLNLVWVCFGSDWAFFRPELGLNSLFLNFRRCRWSHFLFRWWTWRWVTFFRLLIFHFWFIWFQWLWLSYYWRSRSWSSRFSSWWRRSRSIFTIRLRTYTPWPKSNWNCDHVITGASLKCPKKYVEDTFCTWHLHLFWNAAFQMPQNRTYSFSF